MGKTVPVYFGDDEMDLFKKVEKYSKHISKSGYIKTAIAEKIEREEHQSTNSQRNVRNDFPDLLDGL